MPDWSTLIAALRTVPVGGGGFSPSDVSGLVLWLDAGSGVYQTSDFLIQSTGGDSVGGWRDRSTNNNDVVMVNTASRPSYVLNTINSNNVVRFNGVVQYLSSSTAKMMDQTDFTYFAVLIKSSTAQSFITLVGPVVGGRAFTMRPSTSHSFSLNLANTVVIGSGQTPIFTSTTAVVVGVNYNAAGTANLFFNNSADGVYFNPRTFTAESTLVIGARSTGTTYFQGDLAEVIFYDSVLSASSRNQVSNYLAAKYAIWST